MDAREDARAAFAAAVAAADPAPAVHRKLARTNGVLWFDGKPVDVGGRQVWLLGAGKAAAAMAGAVEEILGDMLTSGLIVTKYGHSRPLARTRIIEAGHPFPDDNGRRGATALRDLARQVDPGDLMICVWSGGGSALLPLPVRGLDLADLRVVTDALLRSGCTIVEMNTLRRHLCALSGGRLAALAAPATVRSLVLSDVIGNDLSAIASGPTCPDPTTWQDCAETIARNGLEQALPESVIAAVERGLEGVIPETLKPGDPVFANVANTVISDVNVAVEAAARELRARGWMGRPLRVGVAGEARDVGRSLA
jgi:hydroxypyruvate reductase